MIKFLNFGVIQLFFYLVIQLYNYLTIWLFMHVYMYTCIYVCMYVCMIVCIHVSMYYFFMYVRMYLFMYVFVYILITSFNTMTIVHTRDLVSHKPHQFNHNSKSKMFQNPIVTYLLLQAYRLESYQVSIKSKNF